MIITLLKMKLNFCGSHFNLGARRGNSALIWAGLLASLLYAVICSAVLIQTVNSESAVPIDRKLQLVNSPDVSLFSPHSSRGFQAQRSMQATVVNELVARISSALTAVGGDDQAVTIPDRTTSPPTTQATHVGLFQSANTTAVTEKSTSVNGTSEQPTETADDDSKSDDDTGEPSDLNEDSARNLTDNERLVALQDSLQKEVKRRLKSSMRSSMEIFERVALSGGCSSSLMSLMSNLGELKAFAFKFIDASAKIPSGVMYGLLSDFGDFDQCLSIRSNREVPPEQEQFDSGGFSGKYCLFNVRLNYHVQLGPNGSAPEGIYEDGVLWDELMRNYWTSNSTKGFQVGVCVPSRCTNEDLEQLYKAVAESYNVLGDVISCQDSNDIIRQTTPDLTQLIILVVFGLIIFINLAATIVDRYITKSTLDGSIALQVLVCFSLRRNWNMFMRHEDAAMFLDFQKENTDTEIGSGSDTSSDQQNGQQDYCSSLVSKNSQTQTTIAETMISSSNSSNSLQSMSRDTSEKSESEQISSDYTKPLSIKIDYELPKGICLGLRRHMSDKVKSTAESINDDNILSHLSGIKLFVIVWITIGHSFLYPSANNYQYYRSIINMNITRDSVWFASTNFTLGIDMLLYMAGLVFVYKMFHIRSLMMKEDQSFVSIRSSAKALECTKKQKSPTNPAAICAGHRFGHELAKKILRFWPTYLTVVALAIVIPLLGSGPMWPEMVGRRLGDSCRRNWWANLLLVNNLSDQADICLPSSWFISVMMQLLLLGSLIMLILSRYSIKIAIYAISFLVLCSSAISFIFAYIGNLKAPAIRMDESFVLDLDSQIFRLYTNLFNNMGPFLIGMLGGLILIRWRVQQLTRAESGGADVQKKSSGTFSMIHRMNSSERLNHVKEIFMYLLVTSISAAVLSSVFYSDYTRIWAAIYWSCHRVGWAIVTGFMIHNCAIGKWKLMKDIFSLAHLIPLSRLIFIAYLVYPILIHIHSGLVRDGLHVSVYNMMNIYITRLVSTFVVAMMIHLMVEIPIYSIENLITCCSDRRHKEVTNHESEIANKNMQPLLNETKISE